MLRWLVGLIVLLAALAAGAYVAAGRGEPPRLTLDKPDRFVGQTGSIDITAEAPNARFTSIAVTLEQNGKTTPLFSLDKPDTAQVTQVDRNRVRISRPFGKQSVPALEAGAARVVVTAVRPSFLNLRMLTATAAKDVQVRLEPPRIAVVSTHHYVNHGGAEMVVYRASPDDVTSGVRVGNTEYVGYPIRLKPDATNTQPDSTNAQTDLKAAFFALLWDQDLNTRITAFARDDAGNEATATFVDNVFEKPFKKSRIEIDDAYIDRVVPDIIQHSPELKMSGPTGDRLADFLKINGELRRINNDEITALGRKTASTRLWEGPFVQLGNSKVEAAFADHRTYVYKSKDVDQQVHLGFDLAVTTHVPVAAANDGTVVNASWLGIYGNCIVIDHGMGVQSLYGHLMSFDVKVGDHVMRGQTIGRSDSTGLAGGDHLHFTMLVGGRMVNPVEWWDPHWVQDRVDRKLQEAGSR